MALFNGDSGYDPADWNNDLPTRLFATDRYPKGRLNVYSKPDILSFFQQTLKDTPELQVIKDSRFRELFNLHVSWCPISCQLIHSLLSRQLVTLKNYEFWTVFGGLPLRLSLVEFASLTGLVINLKLTSIEVLDSNCSVVKDKQLDTLIGPIARMLPYIMKSCGAILISLHYDLTTFNVNRQEGIYQNERSGDCGPMSAKFLEMHANCVGPGDMTNITYTAVDTMRKQYALQIYAEYVAPLY